MELERVIDDVQRESGSGGVVKGEDVDSRFAGPGGWSKRQ